MSGDTSAMKTLARRVKQKALEKALDVFENPSKYTPESYETTYQTVLKNAVPRSQEISGDEGGALIIQVSKEIADKNGIDTSPSTDSEG